MNYCELDHGEHLSHTVHVDFSKPHGLVNQPQIPERFHRSFDIEVFDWRRYKHPGKYCPADDRVSETIDERGIWEPAGSILTMSALEPLDALPVLDFGSQIGWYTSVAISCGMKVLPIDMETEMHRLLLRSRELNGDRDHIWDPLEAEISEASGMLSPYERIAFIKADIEGAERHVVRMFRPMLMEQRVDHLMLEISPCFNESYPDLVCELRSYGYHCWQIPHGHVWLGGDTPYDLLDYELHRLSNAALRRRVANWSQENVWFSKPLADWA